MCLPPGDDDVLIVHKIYSKILLNLLIELKKDVQIHP